MLRRSSKPNPILLETHTVPYIKDYLDTKPNLFANLDSTRRFL
jgi:hypothetical protein